MRNRKRVIPVTRKTVLDATLSALILLFLGVLAYASISFAATTSPLNLDFEEGSVGQVPLKWFSPSASVQSGYSAVLTSDHPKSGKLCVLIKGETQAEQYGFGNLMQSFDATPYRLKRVRFRAAVRTEVPDFYGRVQLWLRVDRLNRLMGFFDNMGDRPITNSSEWRYFEIIGDIDQDAEKINIGLMLIGIGKAWLDDVSFEVVGDAVRPAAEPARSLTENGLANVVAFSRLLGYVRHFHPSDEAAKTDWESFAIQGMRAVENAGSASELADKLEMLFHTIAPTVRVFPTGAALPASSISVPSKTEGDLKIIMWHHVGFGTGNPGSAYHSNREATMALEGRFPETLAEFRKPYLADLGGGVTCTVPLALFADDKGTLPHAAATEQASSIPTPTKTSYSARDRATRLADVALAWNVFQHFYPYFDVVKTDWPTVLTAALRSAATDRDELAFLNTLRRMIAALHDGHGQVVLASKPADAYSPAFLWDWIEDRLTITRVKDLSLGLAAGDTILAINGRPVRDVLTETESLISGATPQWIRYRAVQELALGFNGENLELEIEPWANQGTRRTISLKRDTQTGTIQEPRPSKIAELEPGIFYLDLSRILDSDFNDNLLKLADAKGIIFDMRGYPRNLNAMNFFSHLSEKPLTSPRWLIPLVTFPDHQHMKFQRGGEWHISPAAPNLSARKAFIIDGRAISYAESCMGIVENYRLGEIVGGPTAGTNGNVNSFTLPGGYSITWTGMKVLKQDGSQHHGVGVLPTIPISRTRARVAAGRDELLESAIQAVKR
jgi:hypothetical protein